MIDDREPLSESDPLWDFALFLFKESVLLRSMLEFLRSSDAPGEIKAERLRNWEKHIGVQLGNPESDEEARQVLQTILAADADERKEVIRSFLAQRGGTYFQD